MFSALEEGAGGVSGSGDGGGRERNFTGGGGMSLTGGAAASTDGDVGTPSCVGGIGGVGMS